MPTSVMRKMRRDADLALHVVERGGSNRAEANEKNVRGGIRERSEAIVILLAWRARTKEKGEKRKRRQNNSPAVSQRPKETVFPSTITFAL